MEYCEKCCYSGGKHFHVSEMKEGKYFLTYCEKKRGAYYEISEEEFESLKNNRLINYYYHSGTTVMGMNNNSFPSLIKFLKEFLKDKPLIANQRCKYYFEREVL